MELSVVIICRDWSPGLQRAIDSVAGLASEILVYDSGELNNVSGKVNAIVIRGAWEGYGKTRKRALLLAKHPWILSLDSDEVIDDKLRRSISQVDLTKDRVLYKMRFRNFIGDKLIKHGEWGSKKEIRLGCRTAATLAEYIVHERLVINKGVSIRYLDGFIQHYTATDIQHFSSKMLLYAKLSAQKLYKQGKRGGIIKLLGSPLFSFFRNYLFKLGFLDGWAGLLCAVISSWYTFLKYAFLLEIIHAREEEMSKLPSTPIRRFETGLIKETLTTNVTSIEKSV